MIPTKKTADIHGTRIILISDDNTLSSPDKNYLENVNNENLTGA